MLLPFITVHECCNSSHRVGAGSFPVLAFFFFFFFAKCQKFLFYNFRR